MKLIVAVDKNWGIGKDGQLLCYLSGDLKYFKEKTLGKTVVMGRKTLESLPGAKPLPNRKNIVLSRDKNFQKDGCLVFSEIQDFLENCKDDDVMVMGGGSIYKQLLKYCDTCYITKIDKAFEADTQFPNLDEMKDFQLTWISEAQNENGITYYFTEYKRI
jgi:dihydrofolate reductase